MQSLPWASGVVEYSAIEPKSAAGMPGDVLLVEHAAGMGFGAGVGLGLGFGAVVGLGAGFGAGAGGA
ncbi:putative spore protein YtfJ [Microbacterium endophyticum]|uniref:Putative spore protein YtfJ n=1 Tax=Microbacterium endophyticum TaxID=1526412 RepID=A0A7W4V146_9MICO|nr:hypothetical protein [Microbacterium endophyticum]MBB2974941.1 putative spore protein YtfJ [Microbacterium endophyticum]NIK37238.1 putative spore protein YtfJ [Microbacterium endophyticum]